MRIKLDMAHEYAKVLLENVHANHGHLSILELENISESAWSLADAMQAEADKRVNTDRPDIFTKDMHGNCRHMHKTLHGAECFDCGEVLNLSDWQPDWQPDWSVAPDGYNWWAMDEDEIPYWYCVEPYINYETEYVQWDYEGSTCHKIAPSHNYKGDWKDSLRERPTL